MPKRVIKAKFHDYMVPLQRPKSGWLNLVATTEPVNEQTIPVNGDLNLNPPQIEGGGVGAATPVQLPVTPSVTPPTMPTVSEVTSADCNALKSMKSQMASALTVINSMDAASRQPYLTQWNQINALIDNMANQKCIDTAVTPTPSTPVTSTTPTDTVTTAATTAAVVSAAINSGGGYGGGGGGGGGGGSTDTSAVVEKKDEFPWWLVVVVVIGGYFIFKKKKKS